MAKSKHLLTETYLKGHVQPVSGPTASNYEGLRHDGLFEFEFEL